MAVGWCESNANKEDVKVNNSSTVKKHMISQTAEYALRAVVFLASKNGSLISRNDIAEYTQVPHEYLTKVMQELDRHGLIKSQRGPGGGYTLTVSPDSLSVYDVVTAISSLPRIDTCPLGLADHKRLCPLHQRLDEATAHVEEAFKSTFISELVPSRANRGCRFPR